MYSKKVVIVNGETESASILYRSRSAEFCLKRLGFTVLVHEVDNLSSANLKDVVACLFVRTPLTFEVECLIDQLKAARVKVLADFDDLLFRPDLLHLINGVNYLSAAEYDDFVDRTAKYQKLVKLANCVIATTLPLAEAAAQFNENVRVIRNYPLEITKRVSLLVKNGRRSHNQFVIGYYSGTLTHQADFRQCAYALASLMKKRSNVYLRIVGKLNFDEFHQFNGLEPRVELLPVMSYKEMLFSLMDCDLNIAPLELPNAFNQCKSELKYFDAALMCVPTIASPSIPYMSAIKHGVNGYLADTSDDWFICIDSILADRDAIENTGLCARRSVLSFFGEAAQLNDYRNLMISLGNI